MYVKVLREIQRHIDQLPLLDFKPVEIFHHPHTFLSSLWKLVSLVGKVICSCINRDYMAASAKRQGKNARALTEGRPLKIVVENSAKDNTEGNLSTN
jgi:hypothetical protein